MGKGIRYQGISTELGYDEIRRKGCDQRGDNCVKGKRINLVVGLGFQRNIDRKALSVAFANLCLIA